jgi:hypothetical protein
VNVFSDSFEHQHTEKICKFLKLFTISIYQHILASGCKNGFYVRYIFLQQLNAAFVKVYTIKAVPFS